MNSRANELAAKLERFGALKTPEYLELKNLIKEGELDWHDLYLSQRTSIEKMHHMTTEMFWRCNDQYYNAFYDMKELVELINAWYEIEKPYKAPNKIAYGWQFALKKGQKVFRQYLYGCIRNYLNRNNVEWKIIELQIICSLKDLVNISNDGDIVEEWEGVDIH